LGDGAALERVRGAMQALSGDIEANNERNTALIARAQQMHDLMRSVGAQLEADLPGSCRA
jgi:hypothetical protein